MIIGVCLVACGGDDGGAGGPIDAQAIDGPPPICDPLAARGAQGCDPGQRCTWVIDRDTPSVTGTLGCVPDGTFVAGAACSASTGGQPDRCTAGLVCVAGTCQDVCGFDGSANAACPSGQACARYADLFVNGDGEPLAGVCRATCDPLTQLRGDGTPCPADEACYLLTSARDTIAVCAAAGTVTHDQILDGPAYANACVPGAQPRRKDTASMTVVCGGLCKPVDVTSTMARGSEGGLAPDSCVLRWGAAAPDDGGRGESCRYWSAREPFAGLSPYSNTVGWCFKHVGFLYDADGDGAAETSFPRCAGLTMGDVVPPIGDPPHNDALYFWCLAQAEPRGPTIAIPQVKVDRLGRWR